MRKNSITCAFIVSHIKGLLAMKSQMMKSTLSLAVIALFAAGCSTPQHLSYVGPAGAKGATGATGAQGATGATGLTGLALAGPAGAT
ncbi:MAG: hypothetical protein AABM33_14510, partial [Pseudomonadota bacterium]